MKPLIGLSILLLALLTSSPAVRAEEDGEGGNQGGFSIKQPYNQKGPQEHHDPITATVWTLVPDKEGSKAKGTVRVNCYSDDKDNFRMDVQGLDPKKVYTVWFTSSSKEGADRAGIGTAPFKFKPTGGGNSLYQSPLKTCPLIKWKWVEVREHPDGDPANVDGSVRVLKARMKAQ